MMSISLRTFILRTFHLSYIYETIFIAIKLDIKYVTLPHSIDSHADKAMDLLSILLEIR